MNHKHIPVLSTTGYISKMECDQSTNFSAPLGSVTNGRLVFAAGAVGVRLYGDPLLPDLYRAHFTCHAPSVCAQAGVVTIRDDDASAHDRSAQWPEALAAIALNGAIRWEIECRGGLAGLMADLRELRLRALDLGSVSGAALALPRPAGMAFIYLAGSVSDMVLYRPHNVAARIQINGSASQVLFDEQCFGGAMDGIRWQSPDYKQAGDGYDISIAGSASNVTIATW